MAKLFKCTYNHSIILIQFSPYVCIMYMNGCSFIGKYVQLSVYIRTYYSHLKMYISKMAPFT